MSKKQLRSAIIGYGGQFGMGQAHARQMQDNGIELVAVCDSDENRTAQAVIDFPGIRTFTDANRMLAEQDIDLVVVITPHNSHVDLARSVLEHGKHCILEKPMCIKAEDAMMLNQLAEDRGLMLTVYHNRRWDGWYLTVKELIQEGALGEIFMVDMFFGGFKKPGQTWRADKQISGGLFYDWGAHYVDWLLGIMAAPVKEVRGFIHNRLWHDITNEDQMESIMEFQDGATAQLQISTIARAPKDAVRVLGTKGAIVLKKPMDTEIILYSEIGGQKIESVIACKPNQYSVFYENIANHLREGEELIVKASQAANTIAVLEMTEISAKEGRPIKFEQ
ncbi:Gfo/Idh/MocA family protein [Paenibacillus sp. strain BS8-2]